MPAVLPIQFASETLTLLADRALYWANRQTLILADVHLGKDASFRAAGVPIPAGNSARDLARIEALLHAMGARRLVVLGDLVHSRSSHQAELAETFEAWRHRQAELEILLIRGNHDRHAGSAPADWRIDEVPEPYTDGPLVFTHFPRQLDLPTLCGHLHPVVAVRDFDRSTVRIPCFVVDPNQMILPAFGSFTGGLAMPAEPMRELYVATGRSIARCRNSPLP